VLQAELREKLAKMYDVRDINNIFVFGFRNQVRAGKQ
jgi:ribosomal protein S24E